MEIRISIDDTFMNDLQNNMNGPKPKEIIKEALSLLNWAVKEVQKGRVILTSDDEGGDIKQLSMPSLDNVKKTN